MTDHLRTRGAPDRSYVSMDQVSYWTTTLGCSQDELAAAMARVGNSANAVRRELARAWGYGTTRRHSTSLRAEPAAPKE
jgi:Protein of unknown function (DUF3606)